MERLKTSVPDDLRHLIASSPASNLSTTCATLVQYFSTLPQFYELLKQLVSPHLTVCAKDGAAAASSKRDGNDAFGAQNYEQALSCYTKALRYAPRSEVEADRVSLAALFVNRAATLHKLGLLDSAVRDCDRAVKFHPSYSKNVVSAGCRSAETFQHFVVLQGWYRRGKVKFDLRDFDGAVADLEKALSNESTPGSRLQIMTELAKIQHLPKSNRGSSTPICTPSGASDPELHKSERIGHLQKVWTEAKGWSLQAKEDLASGSSVLQEDPYAAIISKSCRDTHCHFCFELLPADPVACSGCAIPLYCSHVCKANACNRLAGRTQSIHTRNEPSVTRSLYDLPTASSGTEVFQRESCQREDFAQLESCPQRYGEHSHECGGASWSAVLPTEAILSTRMLLSPSRTCVARLKSGFPASIQVDKEAAETFEGDTLCHHYDRLCTDDKVELHVLGIVVAHCLRHSAAPKVEFTTLASKLIVLIAQARVNAMAVYGISSPDVCTGAGSTNCGETKNGLGYALCMVKQVRVAQGIFLIGSRLNHSCVPNVHASFSSGRLTVHAVTNIMKDSTLELCYGPQVGQLNQLERRQQLIDSYFFDCSCCACTKLTLPDLFLRAFRCAQPGCRGVVLGAESLESKYSERQTSLSIGKEKHSRFFADRLSQRKLIQQTEQSLQLPATIDVTAQDTQFAKCSRLHTEKIGSCLSCGISVDTRGAHQIATTAVAHLARVESDLVKAEANGIDLEGLVKGATNALNSLRRTLHAYNEEVAKGEDVVARLFCAIDQPLQALKHCRSSIEVLENLYNKHHIVVGNEHLKLVSIALMARDMDSARRSLALVGQIFKAHYGPYFRDRFSYVVDLEQMAK